MDDLPSICKNILECKSAVKGAMMLKKEIHLVKDSLSPFYDENTELGKQYNSVVNETIKISWAHIKNLCVNAKPNTFAYLIKTSGAIPDKTMWDKIKI
jgi:hypothetical protein